MAGVSSWFDKLTTNGEEDAISMITGIYTKVTEESNGKKN
jgi:hypothetical protein